MTLIPITASKTGLQLAGDGGDLGGDLGGGLGSSAPDLAIAAALKHLPASAPVVIMLHGKGYCPVAGKDPHDLIFAPRAGHGRSRFVSWPRRLGFALPGPRQPLGLCIALGWDASGRLWRATAAADATAPMLARLVQIIRRADPARRVDLIGHSLGVRIILGALPLLAAGSVGRVLMLAGADFTHRALHARASLAGGEAEFFNITTRENDLYDFLFERAFSPRGAGASLGRGLPAAPNWLDIQLDNPATDLALRRLGLPLAPPKSRICHWSVYLRPGVFRLYRALLHDRTRLTLPVLTESLATPPEPRWSRLRRRAQQVTAPAQTQPL
ncbi:hypothetical protein [Pararhodobacter oceanensis]|uniref:hypothetical protein n=1 Tax=Pararhodobacter oceanensis TaxID=2172121 RepID=UPI003A8CB170